MTECGWCKTPYETRAYADACERACGIRVANRVADDRVNARCSTCQSVGCRGECEREAR